MSKETYAQAFEVWHKSDPVLRGNQYYDVLGFMQDADREVERLEAENAALREKLEAAVEFIRHIDREYSHYIADKGFEQWRGEQEGSE